jgi:TetR/AcrR family transcriptional repressor of mexJK operon
MSKTMKASKAPDASSAPHVPVKPAGRPRASEVETRMLELIDSAAKLFVKHGYSKVSLETIARESHVAVRTIYVKFGGKAGLLSAVLERGRERFYKAADLAADVRPLKVVLEEFARHFLTLITERGPLAMQRMVIAEARTNPELAQAFYDGGPKETRAMLTRYFSRADIRPLLRDDVSPELAMEHLLNCIKGDEVPRLLFDLPVKSPEETQALLDVRLALFYRGVLRQS